MTGLIIVSDVLHNLWITAHYALSRRFLVTVTTDPFVVSQVAFMVFVAVTATIAWTRARRSSGR